MNRLGFFAFLFFAVFCHQHIAWGQQQNQADLTENIPEYNEPRAPIKNPNTVRPVNAYSNTSPSNTESEQKQIQLLERKINDLVKKIDSLLSEIKQTNEKNKAQQARASIEGIKDFFSGMAKFASKIASEAKETAANWSAAAAKADEAKKRAEKAVIKAAEEASKKQSDETLACKEIQTYLSSQKNNICGDNNSTLAITKYFKTEADNKAKSAGNSLSSARFRAQQEINAADLNESTIAANTNILLAAEFSEQCISHATLGLEQIEETLQTTKTTISETCATSDGGSEKQIAITEMLNFQSSTLRCNNNLKELQTACSETSSGFWSTAGTVGLWVAGIGVVGGTGYLIGRNNGKKRGGGGGGASGGGSDSQNRPNSPTGSIVGSTDGCAPGQARNLQGKCVTVNNPYPGVGATPEPFSNQNSNSSVNIGSDTGNPSSKNLTSNPTSRNLVNSGTSSGNSTTQDSSTSGGTGSSGGQANNSTSGGDTSSGSRAASQSNYSSEGSSFGDSAGANAGDESKNSAAVTESMLSGGNLYPYKVGTTVKYLSYKQCIKNKACRSQNVDIKRKEKNHLERLKKDNKFLD